MYQKTLFIFNYPKLFEILNELKEILNFEINHLDDENYKNIDFNRYKNYLILSSNYNKKLKNSLVIENFPQKIHQLIEKINLKFLRNQFNNQSENKIGKYTLDLNSRKIKFQKMSLDLTEKECDLLIFIQSNNKVSLKELQMNVWHYTSDLETHTVETHIYRIRKKMLEKFGDDNFIKFDQNGYFLN